MSQAARPRNFFDQHLLELERQARELAKIQAALMPHIPNELVGHVRLIGVEGEALVFATDNSIHATQLRCVGPRILQAARQLCKINASLIKIQVIPTLADSPRRTRVGHRGEASAIQAAAESVSDPELQDVLLRIARRAR